jgi:hypothetical protein
MVVVELHGMSFGVERGRWFVIDEGGHHREFAQVVFAAEFAREARDRYPQGPGVDLPNLDRLLADAVVARLGGRVTFDNWSPVPAREGVMY